MESRIDHKIHNATYKQLDEIAACHLHCFPNSLATRLGVNYVKKNLEWFLINEHRYLFFIKDNNKVAGYFGAFIPQGSGDGSTSGMLQYAFKEAMLGIIKKPWLLLNKEVIELYPFIFKNIKKKILGSYNIGSNMKTESIKYLGLVVIGVDTEFRGTSVFTELMKQFETVAKERSIHLGNLSVKKDNQRAIHAYKKQGWFVFKEDAKTFVMRKEIR